MKPMIFTPTRFVITAFTLAMLVSGCSGSGDSSATTVEPEDTIPANPVVNDSSSEGTNLSEATSGATSNDDANNDSEDLTTDVSDQNTIATESTRVTFDINVPIYVSNALQVRLQWGDKDIAAN